MSKRIRTTRQARKARAIVVAHTALRNRLQAEWDLSFADRISWVRTEDSRAQAQAWLDRRDEMKREEN